MSRSRSYFIPEAETFFIVDVASPGGVAGELPFTNVNNINVFGYGQYPNTAGTITQSTFFMGPYMATLSLSSTADLTDRTLTISGTDVLSNPISETLAGPDAGTPVSSTLQYYSVSSIIIDGSYDNISVTSTNVWTSSLFVPDVERSFFNINMGFTSIGSSTSFQLYGTISEIFPTLPVAFVADQGVPFQPNVKIDNLSSFQLAPSTSGDWETADSSLFNTTTPYTAFWVQSNPDGSCHGLNINFLQQGVV